MDESIYMSVGYFDDAESAKVILDTLESMHRGATIDIVDMAMLTKSEDGKIHVHETRDLTTGKGARRGAIILGIFGLIYPPSLIATIVAGGGLGAIAGRIRDTGIKRSQMKEIKEQLEPGMAAVAVLENVDSRALVENTLENLGGRTESHDLGPETSADVAAIATASPSTEPE